MKGFFSGIIFWVFLWCPSAGYSTQLWSWGLNIDGIIYESIDQLSDSVDHSEFDWITGLGSLSITIPSNSTGDHTIISFFDHDTPFWDGQLGIVSGSPLSGQIWEIDEPGYSGGDIYQNFLDGTLDNLNNSTVPDDVSMAMGWNFSLENDEMAVFRFFLSDTLTDEILNSFYISLYDPASDVSVYFSGTLDVTNTAVPEPSSVSSVALGLLGLGMVRRHFKNCRNVS